MFPMMLDLTDWPVAVVGDGPAARQRIGLLDAGGAGNVTVFAGAPCHCVREAAGPRLVERYPSDEEVAAQRVIFTADLDEAEERRIAEVARAARVLLNTEDVRALCDFHVPSMVRRGDLLLTISTNGKSPGLARRLRRDLETRFGPEWAERLETLAEARAQWRAEGLELKELARRTNELIARKGWLP